MGILVMPGWTCCDAWERWKNWKGDQQRIAAASLRDQIARLRNHPSVFVFLNGSDNPPPPDIEQMYLDIVAVGSDVDVRGTVRTGSVLVGEMTIAGD